MLREPGRSQVEFETKLDKLLPRNRALALYWLGVAELDYAQSRPQTDRRRWEAATLMLLRIPAEYGQFHELAAAGLFQAHGGLVGIEDATGQAILARELLTSFPTTYHARKMRGEFAP